jgi:hypothetical protein
MVNTYATWRPGYTVCRRSRFLIDTGYVETLPYLISHIVLRVFHTGIKCIIDSSCLSEYLCTQFLSLKSWSKRLYNNPTNSITTAWK